MKTVVAIISALILSVAELTQGVTDTVLMADELYINDVDEYIYVSVIAPDLFEDYILYPSEYIFSGENCAEIIINTIEEAGLTPLYDGTVEENFYLYAIEGIDTSLLKLTDEAKGYMVENNISFTDEVYESGVLGEFDFTDTAGWIYMVNDIAPDKGMCDYIPKVGDEITLKFSLYYEGEF